MSEDLQLELIKKLNKEKETPEYHQSEKPALKLFIQMGYDYFENITSIGLDEPDYKLIQDAKKDSEKSYSLEEAFRLIDED
jgi:hypothetical protein